jgi:hypothetical protein
VPGFEIFMLTPASPTILLATSVVVPVTMPLRLGTLPGSSLFLSNKLQDVIRNMKRRNKAEVKVGFFIEISN